MSVKINTTPEHDLEDASRLIADAVSKALRMGRFNLASRLVHICKELEIAPGTKEKES